MPDPRLLALARNANDKLADASIRHAIFLERYKTHVVNGVIGSLNPEYDRIIDRTFAVLGRIKSRGPGVRVDTLKQLQALVEQNGRTLTGAYRAAVRSLHAELQEFAAQEARWQIDQINRASPVEFALRVPDPGVFRAIVTAEPFGDPTRGVVRTLKDWMMLESADLTAKVKGALDIGLRQGDTVDQIVARIAGRRGIIDRSRQHVATWVRTASSNTSALTREAVAAENAEVVEGLRFVSTLDSRTSETCATLDGQVFAIGDGPRPPMHPNCRSTMTYVLKSWKQLGIPLKEAPPGTRESLGGQVPADVKFPRWFERQPAAFQREYLGGARYDLWRSGRVRFEGLVDNRHRPLSLRQLMDRVGLEAA